MPYQAPVDDIVFALNHAAGFASALGEGLYGDLTDEDIGAVLGEAGKFATDVLAPLNRIGDRLGTPFKDGAVTMPPGWKEAYTSWAAAGWNGLAAPEEFGGQNADYVTCGLMTEELSRGDFNYSLYIQLGLIASELLAGYAHPEVRAVIVSARQAARAIRGAASVLIRLGGMFRLERYALPR